MNRILRMKIYPRNPVHPVKVVRSLNLPKRPELVLGCSERMAALPRGEESTHGPRDSAHAFITRCPGRRAGPDTPLARVRDRGDLSRPVHGLGLPLRHTVRAPGLASASGDR